MAAFVASTFPQWLILCGLQELPELGEGPMSLKRMKGMKGFTDKEIMQSLELRVLAHEKWLNNEGGERLVLYDIDISQSYLIGADLRGADLQWADLQGADLQGANLQGANLQRADLQGADITRAIFDFSSWPLHCGSFNVKCDERLYWQLVCHLARLDTINCDDIVKEHQKQLKGKDKFCEYRNDVKQLDVEVK